MEKRITIRIVERGYIVEWEEDEEKGKKNGPMGHMTEYKNVVYEDTVQMKEAVSELIDEYRDTVDKES